MKNFGLLVDGISEKTPNPKIFKSEDGSTKNFDLENLWILENNIAKNHTEAIIEQLLKFPISYQPTSYKGSEKSAKLP